MASTLLLMRHGKAKALVEGQQDFDRELTEAGKRSLAATLPTQLSLIERNYGDVQVWASPSARTMQTAQILIEALSSQRKIKVKGPVREIGSLWDQDEESFLDQVRSCEADTVVAVGHNPFMETLVERLTGAGIPLATGSLTAIRLNTNIIEGEALSSETMNETSDRILWFAQGPISQHWRTLVQMEKTIRQWSDAVQTRMESFFDDPGDVETMHKFRVSIRTLRSLIAFVKPWQDPKQNTRMQADLKEVVATTSRLRELDVLSEQAQNAPFATEALVDFCEEEAAVERERVIEVFSGKQTRKRLKRVSTDARSIIWKRRFCEEGLPTRAIRQRFDEVADELKTELENLDIAEVEPTHDVRKSAKRVRYAAENFSDLIGDDAPAIAKGMTDHQDDLGAVCDARVNIDIINGLVNRSDIPEPIAWDLALLRAQNETFLYTTLRNQQQAI